MKLTIKQAEDLLHQAAVKESNWIAGAGGRFRVYEVAKNFDISDLPDAFSVLFAQNNGNIVIQEWQDGWFKRTTIYR